MAVIPNTDHRPCLPDECCVMLIEPENTVNAGYSGGYLTDTALE